MFFLGRSFSLLVSVIISFLLLASYLDSSRAIRISRSSFPEGGEETSEYALPDVSHATDANQQPLPVKGTPKEGSLTTRPNDGGIQSSSVGRLGDKKEETSIGMTEYMRDMIKWRRPKDKSGHWPQYSDYEGKDYDPNRWEGFLQ